ncbi:hypothetical protein ACXET9_06145 [Brachybacterium sp. DNPG3]
MCRPVACRTCGKTTWAGCGQHVDQVMRHVPAAERCPGHDADQGPTPGRGTRSGFLARLFGRRAGS